MSASHTRQGRLKNGLMAMTCAGELLVTANQASSSRVLPGSFVLKTCYVAMILTAIFTFIFTCMLYASALIPIPPY